MEQIKTDFIPIIRENSEKRQRERLEKEAEMEAEKRARREKIKNVITGLLVILFLLAIGFIGGTMDYNTAVMEGKVKTETTSSTTETTSATEVETDDIEKCVVKIVEINNDLITVEYNGNLYDFFVELDHDYKVGQYIICHFTDDMEIVGVE